MQRSIIAYMFMFDTQDETKNTEHRQHYYITEDITDFTRENFSYLAGDAYSIIYAFLVLILGASTDLMNRKYVLCGSCFGWCMTIYLSGFATTWNQLFFLRILMGIFNAISGPCSYSLITDWIPSEGRTLAYSIYAMGVQFGGPMSHLNEGIIDWLGWRAAF